MSDAIPTIAEAARLIAAKELSPVELTRACLARVHALDGELHAFVHLTEERALAEAHAAERAIMASGPFGPFAFCKDAGGARAECACISAFTAESGAMKPIAQADAGASGNSKHGRRSSRGRLRTCRWRAAIGPLF